MKTVDRLTMESWLGSDPYYAGRLPYLLVAAEILSRIPGESALEIGPHRHSLVPGCETMDVNKALPGITYYHDAATTPWPMPDGKTFDAIIGLQVWEHMGYRQREASAECFRRARYVLLSFPYLWDTHDEHAEIDRRRIASWTLRRDPEIVWRVASDAPGLARRIDRIVYLFRGDVP